MGNSTSTNQQTKSTFSSAIAAFKRYRSNSQGSHNNDDQQSTSAHTDARPSNQLPIMAPTTTASHSMSKATATFQPMTSPKTLGLPPRTEGSMGASSSPKSVPGRSGWVSNQSASSPWYSSSPLSSSASPSSHQPYLSDCHQQATQKSHRQSISGPYYRARGMSVNQQENPDDDLISTSYQQQQASHSLQIQGHQYLSPSPTVPSSSPQQPPRLQFQQLHLNPSSPAKTEGLSKEKDQVDTELRSTIITWSQGGSHVYVTGTFNDWKRKIKLVKSTHDFNTVLDLPLGTHRLKFIVDDEWKCSNDMETATDPNGNLVNYIQVMDEDDYGDKLDLDSSDDDNGFIATPTDKYTSVIPKELEILSDVMQKQREDSDSDDMDAYYYQQRRSIMEWARNQPQPPSLPPHLENVLLNSQTVSNEDDSILPVPNHVTLNHMYACSIKDHVLALSATTRYRNKYVTTVYYKPVQ